MARLPKVGGDTGNWGEILNDFLSQSHDSDGTLKAGSVSRAKLTSDITTSLTRADTALQAADITGKADISSLAHVATTGVYADLTSKPTIPSAASDVGAEPAGLSSQTKASLATTYITGRLLGSGTKQAGLPAVSAATLVVIPPAISTPAALAATSSAALTTPAGRTGKQAHWQWWTGTRWDAILPTASGWRIYADVLGTMVAGPIIGSQNSLRVQALFGGGFLWIIYSISNGTVSVSRFTLSGTTYTADSAVMAVQIAASGSAWTATDSDASPLVAYRATDGSLWIARCTATALMVARSMDGGVTWTQNTAVKSTTITGVPSFGDNGASLILMLTLNAPETPTGTAGYGRFGFRHGLTTDINSVAWSTMTLPAYMGATSSDDHGGSTTYGGYTYITMKTTNAAAVTDPLMTLLVIDPVIANPITEYVIENGPDWGVQRPTRPYPVTDGKYLWIFYGGIDAPYEICYRRALLKDLSRWSARVTVIPTTTQQFVDGVSTPAAVLDGHTDLLLLATDLVSSKVWTAVIPASDTLAGSYLWDGTTLTSLS